MLVLVIILFELIGSEPCETSDPGIKCSLKTLDVFYRTDSNYHSDNFVFWSWLYLNSQMISYAFENIFNEYDKMYIKLSIINLVPAMVGGCVNWALMVNMTMYTCIPERRATANAFQMFAGHILGNFTFWRNVCPALPETTGWGGSYSKKIGELSLVDSDSTRREEHAYIGHSSGWAKFF